MHRAERLRHPDCQPARGLAFELIDMLRFAQRAASANVASQVWSSVA
jgi:hypothetical protein